MKNPHYLHYLFIYIKSVSWTFTGFKICFVCQIFNSLFLKPLDWTKVFFNIKVTAGLEDMVFCSKIFKFFFKTPVCWIGLKWHSSGVDQQDSRLMIGCKDLPIKSIKNHIGPSRTKCKNVLTKYWMISFGSIMLKTPVPARSRMLSNLGHS